MWPGASDNCRASTSFSATTQANNLFNFQQFWRSPRVSASCLDHAAPAPPCSPTGVGCGGREGARSGCHQRTSRWAESASRDVLEGGGGTGRRGRGRAGVGGPVRLIHSYLQAYLARPDEGPKPHCPRLARWSEIRPCVARAEGRFSLALAGGGVAAQCRGVYGEGGRGRGY